MKQEAKEVILERLIRILGELKDQRALAVLDRLSIADSERVRTAVDFSLRQIRGF